MVYLGESTLAGEDNRFQVYYRHADGTTEQLATTPTSGPVASRCCPTVSARS
jgi:hypothetical protein